MRLAGKTVLITGCSPNINGGIAYALADEGARLVCVDVVTELAEACARGIRQRGGDAIAETCDVTDADAVAAAVAKGGEAFGVIDHLINGAVVQIRKGLLDISPEEFRLQLDVSLTGSLLFTQAVARALVEAERPGSIVNILSTEGHQGNPGNIGYGTAKGGLMNFTRAAAMELAPFGIRVNSLTPTGTDPVEGAARQEEWGVEWVGPRGARPSRRVDYTEGDQGIPLGRRPRPSEYGAATVFLVSDDAAMVTGIDLRVDGGVISRYWRWNPGMDAR